jgi:hypothetical protein
MTGRLSGGCGRRLRPSPPSRGALTVSGGGSGLERQPLAHDIVDPGCRHVKGLGQPVRGQACGPQRILTQHVAGVNRPHQAE